jgi:hypothetical protein
MASSSFVRKSSSAHTQTHEDCAQQWKWKWRQNPVILWLRQLAEKLAVGLRERSGGTGQGPVLPRGLFPEKLSATAAEESHTYPAKDEIPRGQ